MIFILTALLVSLVILACSSRGRGALAHLWNKCCFRHCRCGGEKRVNSVSDHCIAEDRPKEEEEAFEEDIEAADDFQEAEEDLHQGRVPAPEGNDEEDSFHTCVERQSTSVTENETMSDTYEPHDRVRTEAHISSATDYKTK